MKSPTAQPSCHSQLIAAIMVNSKTMSHWRQVNLDFQSRKTDNNIGVGRLPGLKMRLPGGSQLLFLFLPFFSHRDT